MSNYRNGNNSSKTGDNDYKEKKKSSYKRRGTKDKGEYSSKVSNDGEFSNSGSVKGKFNDVSWYTKVAATEQAARIPFTRPTGRPFDPEKDFGFSEASSTSTYSPGICVLNYVPSVGYTELGVQSPIDRAAHKIWMEFRTKNTGAITYDAPDIMFNLIAGVNIHAFYYELTRVYGLIRRSMIVNNEYEGRILVNALGYNYTALRDNIAEFGVWINTIKSYINDNVHIPKTFTLYNRYVFMNAGIYKDEDLDKFQMYAFHADGYYIFNERVAGEPGFVEMALKPKAADLSDLKSYFDVMWSRYALSESMADIQSGYYKYFGDAFHVLPEVDINYIVEPLYSFDMMRQIQNAVFLGKLDTTKVSKITQDVNTGFINQFLYVQDTGVLSNLLPEGYLMNLFIDQPTSEDVIECTRCMSTLFGLSIDGEGLNRKVSSQVGSSGSEVFTTMDLVCLKRDGGQIGVITYSDITTYGVGYRVNGVVQVTNPAIVASILNSFSYHPTVYSVKQQDDKDDYVSLIICDAANQMVLPVSQLERLNELCVMSQFTIF